MDDKMTKALSLCFFLFYILCAKAQQDDTTFLKTAVNNAIRFYTVSIRGQANLYNGSEYQEPEQTNDQHPFFDSEDWVDGSVTFEGERYDNIPLLFDISADKLVTENFYNAEEMVLDNEKINAFTIGSHPFIKIENESGPVKKGFYEVLYKGPSEVIVRHRKETQERIESSAIEIDFEVKDHYFIVKDGNYFPANNKRAVLKIFADEKHALRQFISKNKIRLRQNQTKALPAIAMQYDRLKKDL
jgi:hypothetical protein